MYQKPSEAALALGKNIQVIHHSADYDGLFSRAVFEQLEIHTSRNFAFVPWDFGDPVPEISSEADNVIVVDLPFDVNPSLLDDPRLIWIDHHKSSIQRAPDAIKGYCIDGVAACRLAYQFAFGPSEMPSLSDFVERRVNEPLAIRLAGEYDIWNRSDPRAEPFQYGLIIEQIPLKNMVDISDDASCGTDDVVRSGKAAMIWHREFVKSTTPERAYRVDFYGLRFYTVCSCHARSSVWFPDESIPSWADALMTWRVGPTDEVHLSLYHAPGQEHYDLSVIATAHGGGGHKGACGFTLTWEDAMRKLRPSNDSSKVVE